MDYLQEGIGLRAMAQRDPLVEYQREGYDLFAAMMDAIEEEVTGFLFNVEVQIENTQTGESAPATPEAVTAKGFAEPDDSQRLRYNAGESTSAGISKNAPCPCGSGKKFKRCHGAD
jgi:preprotein translocase subunit SecA